MVSYVYPVYFVSFNYNTVQNTGDILSEENV